jgi:indolepyruvate ferredoxin oxidoreductase beta subunit
MNRDILICGVGGQGTVLASKIIAAAAMEEGRTVHSAETIGMAQRGGSVTSHVRIGEEAFSPLIPRGGADLLLAFEPAEAVRNLIYLKPGGTVIVNTRAVRPVTESLKPTGYDGAQMTEYLKQKCACLFVDGEAVCAPFGSAKFFNIILLGIAAGSGRLGLKRESVLHQMSLNLPERFLEINRQAFEAGFALGEKESL